MRLADVFVRVRADMADFNKAIAQLNSNISKSATGLGTSFMKAGAGMTRVGNALTTNLTLPILAVGGATAKMALDFNTSMQRIVGLAKVPREEIAGIREEILKMGADIGRDPQELADAFYFVASAGFTAKEAMEVLRISATAAAAGMGQTQDIAQVLGGVLNAYGHDNLTAAHAGDVLTAAIQDGAAEASQFAGVLGFVTPVAASLGVGFDQVTASIAAMTQVGISADTAATNLGQVMASLQKPTNEAEDALNGLGLSSAGLRKELREKGLLATLRTLEERFAGNDEAAAKVFGNIRALRGVTALLGLDTEQLNGIFADTANAAGNLSQAYADTAGPQRDLDKAMAELKAVGIEIGSDVLPMVVDVLKDVAGAAKSVAGWWKGLSDETKKSIVQWAGMIAIGGPLLSIMGKLLSGVGGLFKAVGFLTGPRGIPSLINTLGGLAKSGGLARLALLGVVAAAGLAAAAGVDAANDWFHSLGKTNDELALQAELIAKIGDKASGQKAFDVLKQKAVELGVPLETLNRKFLSYFGESGDWVQAMKETIDHAHDVEVALNDASSAAIGWTNAQKLAFINAYTTAGEAPDKLADALADPTGSVADAAGDLVAPLSEEAQKAKDAAIQAMKDTLTGMVNALSDNPDALRDAMKGLVDRLKDPYTDAEREADIAGSLTSSAFAKALRSNDTGLIADTAAQVEGLLEQYELLEPGALASGKAINPALQKGINSNLSGFLYWIDHNVGQPTTNKFDLAAKLEGLGYTGLAAFVRGMARQEEAAKTQAAIIASRAVNQLDVTARAKNSGYRLAFEFGQGIYAGSWNATQAAARLASGVAGFLPGSEPKNPASALRGITTLGARTVAMIADGMRGALPDALHASGALSAALVPAFGSGMTTMGGYSATGVAPVASNSSQTVNYNLIVEGKPKQVGSKDELARAFEQMQGMNVGAVGAAGVRV